MTSTTSIKFFKRELEITQIAKQLVSITHEQNEEADIIYFHLDDEVYKLTYEMVVLIRISINVNL